MVVFTEMEEFKEIKDESLQIFPPSEPAELCNTDYAGPYDFKLIVNQKGVKNSWEYSAKHNKIYINIKNRFPLNFSVKDHSLDDNFFIRVLPVYEDHRHFQDVVHRCICHEVPQDSTNYGIKDHIIQHIIRCDNAETRYFGNKLKNQRLSLVFPLNMPQVGTDSVREYFYFVCKNSCVGLNRRALQIVFTLENICGTVLGRRVLGVKICSCPKRDKEKDENNFKGKRLKTGTPQNESIDMRSFSLDMNVVGKDNLKKILDYSKSLMSYGMYECQKNNISDGPFRKALNEIDSLDVDSSE